MEIKRSTFLNIGFFLFLPSYWIASEIYYARSIDPKGIEQISDYFERFGDPKRVREIEKDGKKFYLLRGNLPKWYVVALPSSAPAYVFNEFGKFIEGWPDPGDQPGYFKKWPKTLKSNDLEIQELKSRFGI